MGLSEYRDQTCDQYTATTLKATRQLNNLHKLTRGPKNEVRKSLNKLKSQATTPVSELVRKLDVLKSGMKSKVPDFKNNKKDLLDMAKACTPFADLMNGKGSLTDATKSVVDATNNMVADVITGAADTLMSNVEEYTSGAAMAGMDSLFSELKIPQVLGTLDPLINCLDNMCPGSRTSAIVDELNDIQEEMGFDDEGAFDSAKMMQDVGMPADKTENLNSIDDMLINTVKEVQDDAASEVSDLFTSIKKAKKAPYVGKISSYF